MNQLEDLFCLEQDENFERICGEILLTSKGRIAMHCTVCDVMYKNFETYVAHVFEEHITNTEALEVKLELEEMDHNNRYKDVKTEESGLTEMQIEYEPVENTFANEALIEEELPISILEETSKHKLHIETRSTKDLEKQKICKNGMEDEYTIPPVVRNVLKRTSVIRKSVPDEERKHKCPICGLGFKEKNNMRYHFRRHSNEKNHGCPECGKMFYTLSEVRVHMLFHTNLREHLCSDCGRAFKTKFQLSDHIKRHKNQRDFKCKNCDRAFFDNATLQSHVRTHTLERPFSCETCKATFARTTALRNHIKLHENKRAYKCNLCGAGFNQQAGLFSHMKVTHKAA